MAAISLLYNPDLARSLNQLNFCYPAEGAVWISQMAYWYRKNMGYLMDDGKRYIYNSYEDWTKSQITSLSSWKFGKMIRQLRDWGWITTSCFAHLKDRFADPSEIPEEFHSYNTTSWVALNIEAITSLIGWNPFDDGNPQPKKDNKVESKTPANVNFPQSSESSPHTDIASATMGNCIPKNAPERSQCRSIYKNYQSITKSIGENNLKIEEVRQVENGNENTTCLAGETQIENKDTNEGSSIESNEDINIAQEYLTALNVKLDKQEQKVPQICQHSPPIKIAGLDEEIEQEVHQILGKHQDRLGELNVDLNAERVTRAIADNPQHLEDAIHALYENSAQGAKTQDMATGFFYNALRHGWKPRHSHQTSARSLPVYVPNRAWLEPLNPPTLEELLERKRSLWQNAPIMRPSIEAWVNMTDGVAMGEDGPVLDELV